MKIFLRALVLLLSLSSLCEAQVISVAKTIPALPQISTGSITLVVTPPIVSFNLVPGGTATGSQAIMIQTTTIAIRGVTTLSLYGYFTTAKALTNAAGDAISASSVFGLCSTGKATTYSPFTQAGPLTGGSSLLIWQEPNPGVGTVGRTDTLSLKIDLSSMPTLPPGTYSGTLYLQVQAL